MTYQAPYSVTYTPNGGDTLQLLAMWDDTPEPPQFSGMVQVHSTSLVDSFYSYANGLKSLLEQRTIAFFKWFSEYADLASYEENFAQYVTNNQNGILTISFENETWQFTATIGSYSYRTDNFLPPPQASDGNLCLLTSLEFFLTDRQKISS